MIKINKIDYKIIMTSEATPDLREKGIVQILLIKRLTDSHHFVAHKYDMGRLKVVRDLAIVDEEVQS